MAISFTEAPRLKKASPHDVKKAFGVHAQRVLEVIDSHADCLEGLIAHVQELTQTVAALTAERNARVNELTQTVATLTVERDALLGPKAES